MKNFLNAEKILGFLRDAPEIKVLVERERQKDFEEEKRARIDCLARVRVAENSIADKKKLLDDAVSDLIDFERKLAELKRIVDIQAMAHREASHEYSLAAAELSQKHGEGFIGQTLYRLHCSISKSREVIENLENEKSPVVRDENGRFIFRSVSPEIGITQQIHRQRLEELQGLLATANDLVGAEFAPSDIKEICASICCAIGQPLDQSDVVEPTVLS